MGCSPTPPRKYQYRGRRCHTAWRKNTRLERNGNEESWLWLMMWLLRRNGLLLFCFLNVRKPRRERSGLHHAATTKAMPNPKDSATRNRQEGTNRMCQRVGHVEFGHIAPYLKPHVEGTTAPQLRHSDASAAARVTAAHHTIKTLHTTTATH